MSFRRTDWLARFGRLLEDSRDRPFAWGEHDCLRFALRVWDEVAGVPPLTPPPDWHDMDSAIEVLKVQSIHDWATALFGSPRAGWMSARRADIVSFDAAPMPGLIGLGVVEVGKIAVLGETRLQFIPLRHANFTWRVGD